MIDEKDMQEIAAHAAGHAHPRAALGEALKLVQRRKGHVSDEDLRQIAAALGLTADEADEVATFSSLIHRRPVGRHVILLCDSVSCWVTGCDGLIRHLQKTLGIGLGQTTADGRFTLLPAACLGACDRGPAMKVDEDLHVELSVDTIDGILAKYE